MTVSIDSLYPVSLGSVAYVKTTEEPVFVLAVDGDNLATIRRAVQTHDGIKYIVEGLGLDEVESERAKFMRQLEFTEFTLEQRDSFTERRRNKANEPQQAELFGGTLPN